MRTPPLLFGAINYKTDLPYRPGSQSRVGDNIRVKRADTGEVMTVDEKNYFDNPFEVWLSGWVNGKQNVRWKIPMNTDFTIPTLDLVV